jgi:transcriptional regulator with XRE-family HTH domain
VLTPEPGGRPPPALCLACLEDWPEAPFGQRLRAYWLAAGLSQEGLGRRLGVDVASVSRWEKGVSRPRTPLRRLADALGVEVTAFLDEPAPRPQKGRGRPPKATVKQTEAPMPKRLRGRPRKGAEG